MVIWITGLSGSGKTTLSRMIKDHVKDSLPQLVLVDGDEIRELFNDNLGHTEDARVIQIKRLQRLAKLLSSQNLIVIVSALYSHPELLAWNKAHFQNYWEIYLDADLATVQQRDPKKLYAKALAGEINNIVGIDIPWHPPRHADLIIKVANKTAEEIALSIIKNIPPLNDALNK
ncbi:MAG: adenylyl-sulfate kinase [Alphaproteobacteria bacterium]